MNWQFVVRGAALSAWLSSAAMGCGDSSAQTGGEGGGGADTSTSNGTGASADGGGGATVVGGAGAGGSSSAGGQGGGPPAGQVAGIVAVGYGGIRAVSRDQGATWGDVAFTVADGGDDEALLRAVTWGNGLWIATGWHYFTSPDGVLWTDHGRIADTGLLPCNIVEGLAFLDGAFYAVCPTYLPGGNAAVTAVFRSEDGSSWGDPVGVVGESDATTQGHVFMTVAADKLVIWGDSGTTYTSSDGTTFAEQPGIVAGVHCEGQLESLSDCDSTAVENGYFGGVSWFDGVWLKGAWQGKIVRSTDGASYTEVYSDPNLNTPYRGTAFAAGYVAP
ncbi:MAG: hypothetical protein U0271_22475 [Polyangiaceae bacterium]